MKNPIFNIALFMILLSAKNQLFAGDGNYLKILEHENKVDYIMVGKGETFYELSKRAEISMSLLRKYNEFHPKKDFLEEGDILYIEPKKNKSKINKQHLVNQHTTLREIAQKEALKLSALMKLNPSYSPDEELSNGEKIFLQ